MPGSRRIKSDPWHSKDPALRQDEVDRLVEACYRLPAPRGQIEYLARYQWRWALLIKTLWCTAFRVGELLTLRWDDVRDGVLLFFPEKTKYAEPLGQDVPRWLTQELMAYRARYGGRATARVFELKTRQRVNQMVDVLAELAQLGRSVHPHLFRHGAAHALSDSLEGNPRQQTILQRFLHHRSTNHLSRYLRATPQEFADAVHKTFGE